MEPLKGPLKLPRDLVSILSSASCPTLMLSWVTQVVLGTWQAAPAPTQNIRFFGGGFVVVAVVVAF